MKRTILILLIAGIAAAAGFAYIHYARKNTAKKQEASFPSVSQPGAMPASGASNPRANLPDLVHQLPAGATAVVFANFAALRAAPIGAEIASLAPTTAQDPSYTAFVRGTGFDYSRDLDRVALALWPKNSPTTVVALALGKFDEARIERYALRSGRVLRQGRWKIYEVPETNPPRTIRFAFLSREEIALADGPGLSQVLGPPNTERLDPPMSQRVAQVAGAPIFAVARTPELATDLGVNESHSPQLARLLGSVQGIAVAGQPGARNLNVSAAAECDSTLDALQLETALQGLLWMGRAALADPKTRRQIGPQWPALDALLRAADISHNSRFVRLRVQLTPQILRAAVAAAPRGIPAR